jgi:hypothetical protein
MNGSQVPSRGARVLNTDSLDGGSANMYCIKTQLLSGTFEPEGDFVWATRLSDCKPGGNCVREKCKLSVPSGRAESGRPLLSY